MPDGWSVTGQRSSDDLIGGKFMQVMIVNIVTDDGTTKEFRIPEAKYTGESVRAIIDDWYEHQQAVAHL